MTDNAAAPAQPVLISLERIRAQNSTLFLGDRDQSVSGSAGVAEDPTLGLLRSSVEQIGLQMPVIVCERSDANFDLLDGRRRFQLAKELGWPAIMCRVLPVNTPPSLLLELLLLCRRELLAESVVARVRFVAVAQQRGLDKAELRGRFLPALGFEPHDHVLRRCRAAASLPEPLLDFCAAKRFSLKHLVHLSKVRPELLQKLFAWHDRLHLTASIFLELAESLGDLMRRDQLDVDQVESLPGLRNALDLDTSPTKRTESLRATVKALRNPILSEANAELQAIVDALPLPKGAALRWDATLEQHAVRLELTVRRGAQWREAITELSDESVAVGVERLLEKL